jgi:hypothetical protein
MHRTTINLSDQQYEALQKLSRKTGLGMGEWIRRFIDAGVEVMSTKGKSGAQHLLGWKLEE